MVLQKQGSDQTFPFQRTFDSILDILFGVNKGLKGQKPNEKELFREESTAHHLDDIGLFIFILNGLDLLITLIA